MPHVSKIRMLPRSLRLACIAALIGALIGVGALSAAETGVNDFPISNMGTTDPVGELTNFSAVVAYNSAANEYLAVWAGDDDTPGGATDFEIHGQRINAATGALVGAEFAISNTGNGNITKDGAKPAVAYNPGNNEWLVVWEGDEVLDGELDIYSRRVKIGAGGVTDPQPVVRLSDMGDSTSAYDATEPAVACHTSDGTCLVVWRANDNTGSLAISEFEIYGTRVQANGSPAGLKSYVRLSDMGTDGSGGYNARTPAVAYNPVSSQYLVVWSGNEFISAISDPEFEIYGQLVTAAGTEPIPNPTNDFRISNVGTPGEDDTNRATYDAEEPAVAANSTSGNYLVAFTADDDLPGPVAAGENEIYGQLVGSDGTTTPGSHVRLSDMGADGSNSNTAISPAITYNSTRNEYMLAWQGDDTTDNEFEIYGQRVSAAAAELGANDFRISDMGLDADAAFDATLPAVAYSTTAKQYLAIWTGDDNTGGRVDDQIEVFGQRIEFNPPTVTNVNSVADTGDGSLAENESTSALITQLLISFSETVSNTATTSNYLLVNNGANNTFQTSACGGAQGDDAVIAIDSATYSSATNTVSLTVNGATPLPVDGYRLFACATNLTDVDGNALDGNANGTAGDDFARTFTIGPVTPMADLALTKTVSQDPIVLGSGNLTYTLTVVNNGPATSSSVLLTDTLPANVTVASVGASAGATCLPPAGQVRCNLGDMANSATATITIAVTPTASGTLTNNAIVGSSTIDPNTNNNSASVTTTVSAPAGTANLAVAAGAASQLLIGSTRTYTFTVTNGGPNSALAAQLNATTPAGLALVAASTSVGSCTTNSGTGQVTCSLGNLASGASASVAITVRATQAGSKSLTATVSSATADPTLINNSAAQIVTVNAFKVYLPIVTR